MKKTREVRGRSLLVCAGTMAFSFCLYASLPALSQNAFSRLDPHRPHTGDEIFREVINPSINQHGGSQAIEARARSDFEKMMSSQPPMPSNGGNFPLPLFQGIQTRTYLQSVEKHSARAMLLTADDPAVVSSFYKRKLQNSGWLDFISTSAGAQRKGMFITANKSRWQAEISIIGSKQGTSITLVLQPQFERRPPVQEK